MKLWSLLLLLTFISKSLPQTILFPHGYFDANKITAVDAFYLHMLAISALENDGNTEAELDELAAIRKPTPKAEPGSLQEMIEKVQNPEIKEISSEEVIPLVRKERPLTRDNRPPAPFKSRGLYSSK